MTGGQTPERFSMLTRFVWEDLTEQNSETNTRSLQLNRRDAA